MVFLLLAQVYSTAVYITGGIIFTCASYLFGIDILMRDSDIAAGTDTLGVVVVIIQTSHFYIEQSILFPSVAPVSGR